MARILHRPNAKPMNCLHKHGLIGSFVFPVPALQPYCEFLFVFPSAPHAKLPLGRTHPRQGCWPKSLEIPHTAMKGRNCPSGEDSKRRLGSLAAIFEESFQKPFCNQHINKRIMGNWKSQRCFKLFIFPSNMHWGGTRVLVTLSFRSGSM